MPSVTVWSPTVITLATKAAPIVWKRSKRSGGNRPGNAGASGLGHTVETGAGTRGNSSRGVRKEGEDTRGPTRGRGGDAVGPSPDTGGTTRGETRVAAPRAHAAETGRPRAARGGATRGAYPGEAGGAIPGPGGAGV